MVYVRILLFMAEGSESWCVCLRRDMPDVVGWTNSGPECCEKDLDCGRQ